MATFSTSDLPTEDQAIALYERRYLFDAVFHAKVEMVVGAKVFDLADRDTVRLAAGLALILEEAI